MYHTVRPTSYPWMWCLYRMSVIAAGTIICLTSVYFGFKLIQQGATGEFTISGEKGEWRAFVTSVSPGLGLAFLGYVLAGFSYWIQRESWGSPVMTQENTKRMQQASNGGRDTRE